MTCSHTKISALIEAYDRAACNVEREIRSLCEKGWAEANCIVFLSAWAPPGRKPITYQSLADRPSSSAHDKLLKISQVEPLKISQARLQSALIDLAAYLGQMPGCAALACWPRLGVLISPENIEEDALFEKQVRTTSAFEANGYKRHQKHFERVAFLLEMCKDIGTGRLWSISNPNSRRDPVELRAPSASIALAGASLAHFPHLLRRGNSDVIVFAQEEDTADILRQIRKSRIPSSPLHSGE